MLAALPKPEVQKILAKSALVARTKFTLTDPESILLELRRVHEQGYALIDQEVELGLRSIAVPVLTARGITVAALNIGVAATQSDVGQLVQLYLPALRRVQTDLRKMLR
jgi:IclR family pca regulon transcriptional regulator